MNKARNYWPYGVIAVFAIFILGTAGLIVLACTHRTELVSADYYEQEIRFQTQLDRQRRARESGALVAYEPEARRIRIALRNAREGQPVSGRVHLYRPSAAGLDRQVSLATDLAGVQFLDAEGLLPGLWKVRVDWMVGSESFFLDQSLVISANAL